MEPVYKRLSLLKRNPALSREQFSVHYETVHGPLASRQIGFRKFTYCYVQNHTVREATRAGDPEFDGMTTTFQVPRADMQRGFFQEPDYAKFVRPDEETLFDLTKTRSILARERIVLDGKRSEWKALALYQSNARGALRELRGARRIVVNDLISSTAGVLGGAPGAFGFSHIAEMWFDDEALLERTLGNDSFLEGSDGGRSEPAHLFLVREVTIFCDPRPQPRVQTVA